MFEMLIGEMTGYPVRDALVNGFAFLSLWQGDQKKSDLVRTSG